MSTPDHRVRTALGEIMDDAPIPGRSPNPVYFDRTAPHPPKRTLAITLAAAAISVGCITIVATHRNPQITAETQAPPILATAPTTDAAPNVPTTSTVPAPAPDASEPATNAPAVTAPAALTGWYIPDRTPSGYTLVSLSGEPLGDFQPIETAWTHRDPTSGQVTAVLYLGSLPSSVNATTDPGVTVHNLPAGIRQEGRQWIVTWSEAGRSVMARGTDVTRDELLAFAESSQVDGNGARTTAPEGFTVVEEADTVRSDSAQVSAWYVPTDGSPGEIHILIQPNVYGQTTEQLYFELGTVPDTTATIQEFRGRDYIVGTGTMTPRVIGTGTGTSQPFVEWAQPDTHFTLAGTITRDELLDVAASMTPATETQVRDLGKSITDAALARSVVDTATFADGVVVSVRESAVAGKRVLCIEAPVQQCREHSRPSAEPAPYLTDIFDLNGTGLAVVWTSATDAPVTEANEDLSVAAISAAISEVVATSAGQFIEIHINPYQYTPGIRLGTTSVPPNWYVGEQFLNY